MKIYHQQGVELSISNQCIDLIIEENNKNHQIVHAYLELDITLRKNGGDFNVNVDVTLEKPIKLVKYAFAYGFGVATLSTTGGEELEVNKNFGHTSAKPRLLTNKHQNLQSYSDKNDDSKKGI